MKKFIPGIIFLVIFISVSIIYYKYKTGKIEKISEHLKIEYSSISWNGSINAAVISIYHGDPNIFRNNPHHAFVILDGFIKKRIVASFELTKKLMLDEVLQEGIDW